jgi:hypothetical protein
MLFLGWQIAQQADGAKRSLAQKLKERFGSQADPGISLKRGADADVDPALLDALKSRGPSSLRYRLKGEVAQGGMGVILRVWDEDLRRHLAMKVMLDEQEGAASRLSRFLEEAQVTGQLDHPGIVPVHELGIDARGRVFFTMKLVKGRTLEHVFEAVRHGDDGWSVTRALSVVLARLRSDGVCAREGRDPSRLEAREHHGRPLRRDLRDGLGTRSRARQEGHEGHQASAE